MQEKLTKLWRKCETKQLAKIFKEYMESLEVKKWDSRRKDNRNTYLIDAKSTGWNRVQCFNFNNSDRFAEENLSIVLRKEAGNYLIVGKEGKRAFEIDYSGLRKYEEKLLNEIIEEHKPLFDKLFDLVD